MQKTLVVIGGGAAGFFCAVNAAAASSLLKVIILEKSGKVLSKVKVSGGGRCNVTHACFEIPELISFYPRGKNFLKKAFHHFHPTDTIRWFESRGVPLKTEADGRMFPVTDQSQSIIDALMRELNHWKIELRLHADVQQVQRHDGKFRILLADGRTIESDFVCVATGGFQKASQFNWLLQLGHTIETPVPSLFTFNMPGNAITALMGVSVDHATVKVAGSKLQQEGPLLITHWGMSGPAVLKTSAWGARELAEKNYTFNIIVNWLKDYTEQTLREAWPQLRDRLASQKLAARNPFGLPNRLWAHFLSVCGIAAEKQWAALTAKEQNALIQQLTAGVFEVKGKTTFKEEFVTCGGIRLSEIDAQTMQSRVIPGLYFAGEIMDVDGVTGGFNFQHAWTSGWVAARSIAQQINE